MNSKSNRSYKLRTKQMAIHVRSFGQVDNPVITTKAEEGLFTIDDLRNGRCAIIHDYSSDYSIKVLRDVLAFAFPNDLSSTYGNTNYYFAMKDNNELWGCSTITDLPTQSATKFFNQINK